MVISKSEAAEQLKVSTKTISDLVRINGIVPKPIRTNARADGLDEKDLAVLRRALRPRKLRGADPAESFLP